MIELSERALIQRITARLTTPPWVLIGAGDDAAVIEPERGAYEVLTTDAVVEGIHFDRAFVPLDAVGYRALAVNLSDLAAMGAAPRAALLSLVLPETMTVDDVDRLLDGLLGLAGAQRVAIIGGNITRTPGPLVVDVTAIGSVRPRRVLTRAGARPGDEVWVTGSIGAAAAGLHALRSVEANLALGQCDFDRGVDESVARYLRPEPRVRAGVLLGRNRAATSCMDLSDGLGDAVRQVAEASGVGITLDPAAVPLAAGVADVTSALASDDYELLFTVRPSHRGRLRGVRRLLGDLPITKIGVVTKDRAVKLGDSELPGGYEHFSAGPLRGSRPTE